MKRFHSGSIRAVVLAVFALTAAVAAAEAAGQSSSMFGDPDQRQPMTLATHSWTYEEPPEKKEIRLNDLITVIVSHQATVSSEGEMDRKKKAHTDLILKDWILLNGLSAIPDPQSKGDPHISAKLDAKLRSEAGLTTRDSIKFNIRCRVVDIRPNGNLVIEAHQSIRNNTEVWDVSLNGEIDPESILPNGTVLSENVADLRIEKRESGHVRDGYRRGWFLKWLDKWQPF